MYAVRHFYTALPFDFSSQEQCPFFEEFHFNAFPNNHVIVFTEFGTCSQHQYATWADSTGADSLASVHSHTHTLGVTVGGQTFPQKKGE